MKALVLEASGAIPKMSLRDVPEPELGPHDALLRVLAFLTSCFPSGR